MSDAKIMGGRGGEGSQEKPKRKDTEVAELRELVTKREVRGTGAYGELGNKEGEQSEAGPYR